MPINTEHICDTCGKNIEWEYHTTEVTTIKNRIMVDAMFWPTQPKEIFCSMECLAKRLEWFAKRYDELHKD